MAPRRLIIDTDPGVDDIMAMLLAFSAEAENIQVLLISVTYGNIDIQNCLRNVVSMFHYLKREILWRESVKRRIGFEALRQSKPVVAVGAEHPLAENNWMSSSSHTTPAEIWGRLFREEEAIAFDGEPGDIVNTQNESSLLFTPSTTPAHLEILRMLRENEPDSITIVAIGPMTNLALAAGEDPETFLKTKEVVVMGGNIETGRTGPRDPSLLQHIPKIYEPPFRLIKQVPGPIRDSLNIRNQMMPAAEFNTYADSVAAARVYALTSPKPYITMPLPPLGNLDLQSVPNISLLPPYPDNLTRKLHVTLFPLDITEKHALSRGDLEVYLQPQLAAKSPLAEWISDVLNASFEKVALLRAETSRDAISLQLHDPLTTWYCLDDDKPKWEIIEGEDLRVETTGQWTRGMFVKNGSCEKRDDHDHDQDMLVSSTNGIPPREGGNRLDRCVGSPGQEDFGRFLLQKIFSHDILKS